VIPRVCQALNSFIVPSMNSRMPILPTFCVEVLPDNFDVSMRQALYHGCIGARAMQALQSYGETTTIFDNKAYTIVVTCHHEMLRFFSIHPTRPVDGSTRVQYYMNRLGLFGIGNANDLTAAITAYRNLRDWTRGRRDEFIEATNGKVILILSLVKHILKSPWLIIL
jgi:hypothetical protein